MARPVSAVTHTFEELKKIRIRVQVGGHLLGELVIVHPLTQLKTEPNIVGNIFITKIYFNLELDIY